MAAEVLGVISSLRYLSTYNNDKITIYEWNGPVFCTDCPAMCTSSDSENLIKNMILTTFTFKTVQLFFVNHVRGKLPMSGAISALTHNIYDGAFQCSKYGPDCWKVPKPHFEKNNIYILVKTLI